LFVFALSTCRHSFEFVLADWIVDGSVDYLMKCDDDTYVRVPLVMQELQNLQPNSTIYMGSITKHSTPHRDRKNKWYISHEDWSESEFPPFAHGPGYILSRDMLRHFADEDARGEVFPNVSIQFQNQMIFSFDWACFYCS
jgi:hypothetical protein